MTRTLLTLTALLLTSTLAHAQDSGNSSDLSGLFGPTNDPSTTPSSSETGATSADPNASAASGLSRNYPITLNMQTLSKKGATPNTAYVLLRDLKTLMQVKGDNQVTLKTPGYTLVYQKYSREARINTQRARLNATPINVDETSLFPLAALKLLGCSYEPLEPMKQLRTYAVSCPGADEEMAIQAFILKNNNPGPTPLFPSSAPR